MNAEELAKQFHETYERLAPVYGYATRKETAIPWENIPEDNANKRLMIAVAEQILQKQPAQPSAFVRDWVDHRQRVAGYLHSIANDLMRRAAQHDYSKLSPEEFGPYEEAFPALQEYPYGSEGFKAALKTIEGAVAHHYQSNDHHPEHFKNGVNSMTLVQLIEMLFDWIAASERSQTDFMRGLDINKKRFGLEDQLFEIIKNTIMMYAPSKLMGIDPNTLYPDVLLSGPVQKPTQE